jgi:methionyl-tRNA synthetase
MKSPKRYLVTSALPYANGPLHIGHLTGAYLSADVFVRYLRLMGKEVVWVCGSDEHGAAITLRAAKENSTPQAIIDKYDAMFRKTFMGMGVDFDIFHRTSSALHHETTQDFFRTLFRKGEFVEQESEQYFDEVANKFLADRYIVGTCPKCANPDAYGDQCEKCGSTLSPTELLPPLRSAYSKSTPILKKTTHWYLPLNKYEAWLKNWIETGTHEGKKLHDPNDWKAHVLGQCKSWLEGGLHPRAMTRDLDWGVDVPRDISHSLGKKIYVWMDAPIGYISATKQWALDHQKDWKKYWQDKDTALIHFIGKDNIVFHCLIFPAILEAHGDYILPKNVPANQFMNLEGRKISTSKNWAVWVHEYLEDFPDKQDILRYNMIKNMPENQDSEFTWKRFQESNNNELVNNLANFMNRVMVLTNKYFDAKLPEANKNGFMVSGRGVNEATTFEAELKTIHDYVEAIGEKIMHYDFRGGLQAMMEFSTYGNQFLQFNEPWRKVKTDLVGTAAVLNVGLQIVAALSVAVRPFLPFTSDAIRNMLKMKQIGRGDGEWATLLKTLAKGKALLEVGHPIGEPVHLFTRIPDEVIAAQMLKLESSQQETLVSNAPEVPKLIVYKPLNQTIPYEDFAKLDIRTGTILEAERVPKTDKLLKLTVDLGFEKRTIVSGIAEHFDPQKLIQQRVLVVANLAPRKMKGIESQGMILSAENDLGKLGLVGTTEIFGNGFIVK